MPRERMRLGTAGVSLRRDERYPNQTAVRQVGRVFSHLTTLA
jgi:hypothetical protein